MKVVSAHQGSDGFITASVEMPNGGTQTVRLHKCATAIDIKVEAARLASEAAKAASESVSRDDLLG